MNLDKPHDTLTDRSPFSKNDESADPTSETLRVEYVNESNQLI